MASSRRKRHPGVVLIKPDHERRIGWRARYKDPDTKRLVKVSLPVEVTTDEQRRQWAAWKARELAKRQVALDAGAAPAVGNDLSAVVEKFFKAHGRLRPGTTAIYRRVADKLVQWGKAHGVDKAEHLTRAKLAEFRTVIVNETRHAHLKGTPRRQVADTGEPRSGHTVNGELRKLGTILKYVCDLDLLPKLSYDDLRRTLKKVTATVERHEFLQPGAIRQLLEACRLHDEEVYVETRDEHAGEGRSRIGSTPRYEPVAPFVAYVLMTGCRFGEAVGLMWSQVDLAALDSEGSEVGEVYLSGESTKTHRARTIDLAVSPALRELLIELHEASGGEGEVFGLTRATAEAAAKRLRSEYGAPASFTWQGLRRTCGTYLTNAPGIFGAASAYRSAKQLGHAVAVAERHYLNLLRGIPREARTLEAAMQVEGEMARLIERVRDSGESIAAE